MKVKGLGRRGRQLITVLSDGQMHHMRDIATEVALLEIMEDGKSKNDAEAYIQRGLWWWRVDCYASINRLCKRGLVEKCSPGYFRLIV